MLAGCAPRRLPARHILVLPARSGVRVPRFLFQPYAKVAPDTGSPRPPNKPHPHPAEEILHGIALMTGADSTSDPSGPAGTANPVTLFRESDDAGILFCTQKKPRAGGKPAPLSALNAEDVAAHLNASGAAAAGDAAALKAHYARIESILTARFLQYSLQQAYVASKAAPKSVIDKAGACRAPCLRESQQVRAGRLLVRGGTACDVGAAGLAAHAAVRVGSGAAGPVVPLQQPGGAVPIHARA